MKKLALPLGLAVVLFTFVVGPLTGTLLALLSFEYFWWLTVAVASVISIVAAIYLAPLIQADEPPPEFFRIVTLAAVGFVLLRKASWLVGFDFFGLGRFLWRADSWALIIITLGVLRFVKPRYLLLIGLTAFVMQLGVVLLLKFVTSLLPDWLDFCVTLVIAFFIARWLSLGEESPADRIRKPLFLWCFAGAAVTVMLIDLDGFYLGRYVEQAAWVAFLVSFVLMVDSIEPDDPDHHRTAMGADYGLMFMMLVALYSTVAMIFNVYRMVTAQISLSYQGSLQFWLPLLISVGVAMAIMYFLRLGSRMRDNAPGRSALKWGVILFFVAVLAGGSIFGAGAHDGTVTDILGVLATFAILVLPIMVVAQVLMSIGLLRVLFHLDTRLEGQ